jgi:hypothetical protein
VISGFQSLLSQIQFVPLRLGNATTWSGESATVVAHGPAHGPADRAFDVVDVRGGRAGLRGLLPRAGSYTVAVSVDGGGLSLACTRPLTAYVLNSAALYHTTTEATTLIAGIKTSSHANNVSTV